MKQYIEANKERFFEELFSLLRIPSVSSLEQHKPDMQRCAERLVELLMEAGADEAAVYPTTGHPVVFGQKMVDPSLPTVLVYGHYDVQPVDPIALWHSDPFNLKSVTVPSMPAEQMMTRDSSSCISRHSNSWFVKAVSSTM